MKIILLLISIKIYIYVYKKLLFTFRLLHTLQLNIGTQLIFYCILILIFLDILYFINYFNIFFLFLKPSTNGETVLRFKLQTSKLFHNLGNISAQEAIKIIYCSHFFSTVAVGLHTENTNLT